MRKRSLLLSSLTALAFGLSAHAAVAATFNNHFETDLENYRACKVDEDGNRLYSCHGDDVRSGSKFYIAHGQQGSITVTNTGTVKAKIEGLSIDNGVSYACQMNNTFQCELMNGQPTQQYRCKTGPKSIPGACAGYSGTGCPCDAHADCSADACVGGPQNDKGCNPANPDAACRSLANVTGIGTVVLGGNTTGIKFDGPFAYFALNGDDADPANGCTKLCQLNTNASGVVNSDSLTCVSEPNTAPCTTSLKGYHVTKVLDMDGKALAVPAVGTATIGGGGFGVVDPARYGDVCRGGSPPADCAYDQ
jgi:hypothetical protein